MLVYRLSNFNPTLDHHLVWLCMLSLHVDGPSNDGHSGVLWLISMHQTLYSQTICKCTPCIPSKSQTLTRDCFKVSPYPTLSVLSFLLCTASTKHFGQRWANAGRTVCCVGRARVIVLGYHVRQFCWPSLACICMKLV